MDMHMPPQGQMMMPPPFKKDAKEKKINLMKVYQLKHRALAFQLDPDLARYQGQVTFELVLSEALLKT